MKAKVNRHQFTWEKQMAQNQGLASSRKGFKIPDRKAELGAGPDTWEAFKAGNYFL